jgi:hypothetical protein
MILTMIAVSGCGAHKQTYDYGFSISDQTVDEQSAQARRAADKYLIVDLIPSGNNTQWTPAKRIETSDKKTMTESGSFVIGSCLNGPYTIQRSTRTSSWSGQSHVQQIDISSDMMQLQMQNEMSCDQNIIGQHDYSITWSLSTNDVTAMQVDGKNLKLISK